MSKATNELFWVHRPELDAFFLDIPASVTGSGNEITLIQDGLTLNAARPVIVAEQNPYPEVEPPAATTTGRIATVTQGRQTYVLKNPVDYRITGSGNLLVEYKNSPSDTESYEAVFATWDSYIESRADQ